MAIDQLAHDKTHLVGPLVLAAAPALALEGR